MESVKIDLRGIILLEAEGKQNLRDFSEAGLSEINYADYLEEVTYMHTKTAAHEQEVGSTEVQYDHVQE